MKDRTGTVMLRLLPDMNYADGQILHVFQPGSNYAGMEVKRIMTAKHFLVERVREMRQDAGDIRVTTSFPVTETIEAFQKTYQTVNTLLVQLRLPPITFDGAKIIVEYTENGISFREELATVITDFRGAASQ